MGTLGILEKVDGRQVGISGEDELFYLRKNVDPAPIAMLIGEKVEVQFEVEKGFKMVTEIKPVFPVAAVEKTPAQPEQAPTKAVSTANEAAKGAEFATKGQPRTQKDIDILTQWSYGQATQATWSSTSDALMLNTDQLKARIRELAAWYRNEVLSRNG